MEKNKKNIIGDWLAENGNPEIDIMVKHNLAISTKITRILKEKGIGKTAFAKKMGKSPSEVSKWLSGSHNFTIKTIAKLEYALGEKLIHIEKEYKYVKFYIAKTENSKKPPKYSFMSSYAS
ncbi:helix-turn-helix protein [Maribacter vaceletii]|uniref:Helix-turn-helix protein n=1 Tax=Maribacter vaceletii TaxID=1206816 RepID=A0A495ED90_9FLAO|nr:helix-turn-helix transcriptional regulator [Maribacter vaceletii]RKR14845.1 helix-turn-helix protein [Maribacter vaceletii]